METSVELASLASAAAVRLIDLLATDCWGTVKSSVLSLWRSAHPERVEEELNDARAELLQAQQTGDSAELQGLLAAEWQARIIRLLATRPNAVDELRALFGGEPAAAGTPDQQITGSMTLKAHVSGGDAFLAGRDMNVTRDGQA
ncbi:MULTISPECIES: hypothetical protein [Streptomyces]|uniref:Uncharacterized protein n=1 Tax=Streptomyces glycanivorans TaxID=3033808 RepID=A0ABY9JG29_9ACTN|nr:MULTISPECIES: hypothetical protein [unclassified Streptomyces]TXS08805.1 hypothetical protein EAO68_32455 [Streptomyces sp. wa22]WLQ66690.1 hypothetical protein P8A20_25320 [Streptomyces sp. Alt3]